MSNGMKPGFSDLYLKSMFYEQLVEHVFIAELLQEAWYYYRATPEVLRAEVDAAGYDLVVECNGVLRHIQLKCSRARGKTKFQKLNIALARKPSGCAVWMVRHESPDDCRMKLEYLFFGGDAGQPLPSIEQFKIARHAKANVEGVKATRPSMRKVPMNRFKPIVNMRELIAQLFGLNPPAQAP